MATLYKELTDNLSDNAVSGWAGKLGDAIGKGILAGAAGTAAISASQAIEMQITGREPSSAPADAAQKVLDVKPKGEENKEKLATRMHWAYGVSWGIPRAILHLAGVKGPAATAIHFGAVLGTAMVMLPALKVAPPVTKWSAKQIMVDALHHAVFAMATGLVCDAIFDEDLG